MVSATNRIHHPVTVAAVADLAPRMRRFTIVGDGLRGMDVALPGQWMKTFFPADAGSKPHGRAYTIRRFDPGEGTMDLDFVLHGDGGRASAWAGRGQVGDRLEVAGPREGYAADPAARAHLLVGDSTALPAVAAIIETLDPGVAVHAFVEVTDEAEASLIPEHPGLRLHVGLSGDRTSGTTGWLEEAVRTAELPAEPQAFAAGEALMVRAVRLHLTTERGLPSSSLDASGYWRVGIEDHRDSSL